MSKEYKNTGKTKVYKNGEYVLVDLVNIDPNGNDTSKQKSALKEKKAPKEAPNQ